MILTEKFIRKIGKEVNEKLLDELNKLMNGELVAHWQYEIAAKTCIGPNQSYLVKQFEEHAKDEYDHYEKLMTAFLQRGGKPNLNLVEAVKDALPITDELKSNISEYYREFFHKAEESAISAYESYLKFIGDMDPDLADIVTGIISDERDHDLDMERLVTKDNPNVVKNFSESAKEIKVSDIKTSDVIWVKGYGKVKVTSIQKHGGDCLINFIDKDGSEDTIGKDCDQAIKVYGDKNMKDIKKDINFAENVLGFSDSKLVTFPGPMPPEIQDKLDEVLDEVCRQFGCKSYSDRPNNVIDALCDLVLYKDSTDQNTLGTVKNTLNRVYSNLSSYDKDKFDKVLSNLGLVRAFNKICGDK